MKIFILLALFSFSVKAQESLSVADSLAFKGREILESSEYAIRKENNDWFLQTLKNYVTTDEGFYDELKGVTNMLRLANDKKDKFRIFTWQMPDSTFKYKRFGLVVVKTKRGYVATVLNDRLEQLTDPEFQILRPTEWPGAIYYNLLPEGQKNSRYTLLGLALGEPLNKKIVEIIEIRNSGKVRFGAKMFYIDQFMDKTLRKPPMRLIMPYSAKYSVTVNWNAEEKKVIMDHLAPPDAKLKGLYQSYGPDFTYDGLYWKKDWWYLESNVQFNTKQDIKAKRAPKPLDLPE